MPISFSSEAHFPDIGGDDELRSQRPAGRGRKDAGNTAIFKLLPCPVHRPSHARHGATGADGRWRDFLRRWPELLLAGNSVAMAMKGISSSAKVPRQILRTEAFQSSAVEQPGPEYALRHLLDLTPGHSRGKRGTDQTADACAGDEQRAGYRSRREPWLRRYARCREPSHH